MADFLLSDDFGARVKNKANLAGKISYLAPEVFRGGKSTTGCMLIFGRWA